jgi:hypothetical protein
MPPSGFTTEHTRGISDSLMSCLKDLITEGKTNHLTPEQALTREITQINADLKTNQRSEVQTAMLKLVQTFYIGCRARHPTGYENLRVAGRKEARVIASEIEDVKVEELSIV